MNFHYTIVNPRNSSSSLSPLKSWSSSVQSMALDRPIGHTSSHSKLRLDHISKPTEGMQALQALPVFRYLLYMAVAHGPMGCATIRRETDMVSVSASAHCAFIRDNTVFKNWIFTHLLIKYGAFISVYVACKTHWEWSAWSVIFVVDFDLEYHEIYARQNLPFYCSDKV
mgnify:CR=1 FL=1